GKGSGGGGKGLTMGELGLQGKRGEVKIDDPNITIEEYIRLEEEKAHRCDKVYNWETATYGKICEIDFRVLFDDSDDEDYTDLDYFKDFENEFPAIVYNNAQTSKLDFLPKPTVSPQHIDEFNLKDETSLSECDEEEQNVLNFNDLFPFNVIYPNDSKSDKDNDDDKVDIEHSSVDLSVKPLPDVINIDVGAYVQGSNKLLETRKHGIGEDALTGKGSLCYHIGEAPAVKMDNPNITMGEYIRLQEEKALSRAIVLDNTLTSDATISCGPTVSPLNDNEIDFRISFDESDDEDYTVVYDENSFSYKIISVNNLKTDSENDNDKVNMPSFPSPEPIRGKYEVQYNRVQRSQNVSESEEEFEEGTKEEIKEEEEDSPEHFDTFPSMKELRLHYNGIMSKRLGPRRKPSNPRKICNFVGRVKGLKVLVGNFTYNCDFVVLEDTTSVIDHDLMLYFIRRSLEVLKKFDWMILGGRFNQLSHVSSPLLSKPGEY
ncbi:hypothetical protein Tco_0739101, partial [Tanacetum coccineum]